MAENPPDPLHVHVITQIFFSHRGPHPCSAATDLDASFSPIAAITQQLLLYTALKTATATHKR